MRVTDEDEYFPPPRNLRELQAAIEAAATTMLGGAPAGAPRMDDRSLSASDVLAALAISRDNDVLRSPDRVTGVTAVRARHHARSA